MRHKADFYLALSTASLVVGLAACHLIAPKYFLRSGGVSNYGVDSRTIVPYTAGLLAASGFAYAAARQYPRHISHAVVLSAGIAVFAVLLVLMLASTFPYKLNQFYYWNHVAIGTLLLGWQVLFGARLALVQDRNVLAGALLVALVGATGVAAYSFFGPGKLLPHGQIGATVAFGLLLIVQARRLRPYA